MQANTRQVRANTGNRIALGVLIILVSLFSFLSDVRALGGVGRMVASFTVGFFGLADYAYSVAGVIIGVAVVFNLRVRLPLRKIFAYIGLLVIAILALHVYTSSAHIIDADYGEYLLNCYRNTNTAGGMLFGVVAYPLMRAITSVGALILVCAAFFVLAFFACFPYIKKSVTYSAENKTPKAEKKRFSRVQPSGGVKIEKSRVPEIVDLSRKTEDGAQVRYGLDVDGVQTQSDKRAMGAGGYNPLYPNAATNIEDEQRVEPAQTPNADRYTPRGVARDILFGEGPAPDNLRRFETVNNPGSALSNPSAPYSAVRRRELMEKLGLTGDKPATGGISVPREEQRDVPHDFSATEKRNTENPASTVDSNAVAENAEKPVKPEQNGPVLGFSSFEELKAEQMRLYGEMTREGKPAETVFSAEAYNVPQTDAPLHAEIEKRDVVKPTVRAKKPDIQTGENVGQSASNMAGLSGAVARAITGEKKPEAPKPADEIVSEAYEKPAIQDTVQHSESAPNTQAPNTQRDILKVSSESAMPPKPVVQPAQQVPTSTAQAVQQPQAAARSAQQAPVRPNVQPSQAVKPAQTPAVSPLGQGTVDVQSADISWGQVFAPTSQQPAPQTAVPERTERIVERVVERQPIIQQTVVPERTERIIERIVEAPAESSVPTSQHIVGNIPTGNGNESIDSDSPLYQSSFLAKKEAESIARARREAPPMSELERAAAEREKIAQKKRLVSTDKIVEKKAREMEKLDTDKERLSQVTIDQSISQVTPKKAYVPPTFDILLPPEPDVDQDEDYEQKKQALLNTLRFFDIEATVQSIQVGPTFSLYTLSVEMPKGRTIGSLTNLESDIAMKMEEESVRILAPIPGKNAVGIEVPNKFRRMVRLSEILEAPEFNQAKSPSTFCLGKDLYGKNYVCDIKELPHVMIAGATNAGKSCCINSLIVSLLYKASPEDVRLILIDPKRVELSVYEGIPHLMLDEIICDVDKAIRALNWAITEMNRRIEFLSQQKFRDIDEYNKNCEANGFEKMPRLVIVVDELADLMSMGKKAVEDAINRLARLARAVGINLVLATQRPSVDVVSGTIKNNLPSRIAFKVTSGPDSRTILDAYGADKLLGKGDLLYMTPKIQLPIRMQGAFISNEEVKDIVDFIKAHNDSTYDPNVKEAIYRADDKNDEPKGGGGGGGSIKKAKGYPPELFDALRLGMEEAISVSYLQRRLALGWQKAARIGDIMKDMGVLVPDEKDPKKSRVNMTEEEFNAFYEQANTEDDD